MKKYLRTIGELLGLALLAGLLLIAVIVIARYVFDDEKAQYFVIGYYCAVHNDLARWIWKRLGIEKPPDTEETRPRKEQL